MRSADSVDSFVGASVSGVFADTTPAHPVVAGRRLLQGRDVIPGVRRSEPTPQSLAQGWELYSDTEEEHG